MKKYALALPLLLLAPTPARATGGLVCNTAGPGRIEVSLGFPHGFGAPLFLTRLRDNGRDVPVSAPQWWLDDSEVRLLLQAERAPSGVAAQGEAQRPRL